MDTDLKGGNGEVGSKRPPCVFSPGRRWRYVLWREWLDEAPSFQLFEQPMAAVPFAAPASRDGTIDKERAARSEQYLMVIGLNPSTADETVNDRTVARCIALAKREGFGALCMTNLFAWRDTQPADMKRAAEPVGAENDRWLLELAKGAGLVLAAWGTHGPYRGRDRAVLEMFAGAAVPLHCLRLTKEGHPAHPLYLPGSLVPVVYGVNAGKGEMGTI